MKKQFFLIVLVLLVIGGTVRYLLPDESIAPRESTEPTARTFSVEAPSEIPKNAILASSVPEFIAANGSKHEITDIKIKDDILKMFQADERDNLVLNESTRLNIEKLYALNSEEELELKLQKISNLLPPEAHRQLVHLIDYFDKYITASKEIYSPDMAPASIEEALDQLDGLHSLRETHFGFDVAAAFFTEEEKLNRQLLETTAQGERWNFENTEM